tara:strand:- start:56 stop:775 length:720 start_codon:yes stop_codon:yes gene_type:complete
VKITFEMQKDVLNLRASGMPAAEIAKKVGLSVRSVQRIARVTAYHEAGHAAAGAIFKQNPDWATIIPDPKANILAEVTRLDGDLVSEEGLKEEIIFCYAGQYAELRAGSSARRAKLAAMTDDETARDYILRLCGEDATEEELSATEEEMRAAASEFINEHWALVERIATELLERTTLVWEELDGLRAIYLGEKTEEDLRQWRESFANLDEQCSAIGKTAVYKGSSKQFAPDIISTWSCE